MKISEMTTDQACEAVIRITNPIANITDDQKLEPLMKELASYSGQKNINALKIISSMLPKIVPLVLKDHKTDVYEIVSVLSDKKPDEIGKMKLVETVSILRESIDEDLIGFFKQSSSATKTAEEELH